jgi:ABC-type glycerol-3-phosphate transport system substrate-binding protein
LFMRSWPYAWAELNEAGSSVAGVVGVAPLPQNANGFWCDGFAVWGLSEHPEEASWLVAFLTGTEQQKERATELDYNPTRNSVYERSPEGWGAFGDQVGVLQQASEAAVPLPTVRAYQEVADILDSRTYLALSGERSAEKAIEIMYDELVSLAP